MSPTVLVERSGNIAQLILNRPEALNAIDNVMGEELGAACDELTASGLPLTLEHGDLWVSNIYVGDAEPQFIDWTDASISHPFLSLGPLLRSVGWDPHLADQPNA